MRAFNPWEVLKIGELHNVKLIDLRLSEFLWYLNTNAELIL